MEKFNILRDGPVMAGSVGGVGEGLTACSVGVRQGRIGWEWARPTRSSLKTDKKLKHC
jgi:hypothetical protein